jgi:hypothetical protein
MGRGKGNRCLDEGLCNNAGALRIPGLSGRWFRFHPDSHSNGIRTRIPGYPDKLI